MTRTASARSESIKGRGWHGDTKRHKQVGELGGQARKKQMQDDGISYQELGELGGEARKKQMSQRGESYEDLGKRGATARWSQRS